MGATLRVHVKFSVSVVCVWRGVFSPVCSSGLGTICIHPSVLCLSLSVRVVVRVLLYLKHLLDDSPNKRGPCVSILCETVCLLTHLMDCKVRKVGELANTERGWIR